MGPLSVWSAQQSWQKKLLAEADLTLARAVDIAKGSEAALQGAHALKNGVDPAVGAVESQPKKSGASRATGAVNWVTPRHSAVSEKLCAITVARRAT